MAADSFVVTLKQVSKADLCQQDLPKAEQNVLYTEKGNLDKHTASLWQFYLRLVFGRDFVAQRERFVLSARCGRCSWM